MVTVGRLVAFLLCVLALPLHLMICVMIRFTDGHAAIYRCERLGRFGTSYILFKYRTMKMGCPPLMQSGFKAVVHKADPRVTLLGRFLRCGIDELPQLWNIVRGEMAWIGPRPDESWMLPNYGPNSKERLMIAPGISGMAQVLDSRNQPTAVGYAIDLWYKRYANFFDDLWVMCATPLFMLGWRSLGKQYLARLMHVPEFSNLVSSCQAELDDAERRSTIHTERLTSDSR
jgi:undecaprenyl phosphate N,N'-diacetylbacillosamine 1-phosphate transferase